ncbi:MAG: hypothetical protein ACYC1D_05415 [Acidimicrobiales bacterium]
MTEIDLDRQGLSALLTPYLGGRVGATNRLGPTAADRALVAGAGPIKTFTVESDGTDAAPELLAQAVHQRAATVSASADPDLWVIQSARLTLFVDVLDPRFWLLHTASPAARARSELRRWVWDAHQFDRCWFPQDFLRQMQAEHTPRWFKADFRGDAYLPAGEEVPDRLLRVQLEGDGAARLFDILRADPTYATAAALSALGFTVVDTAADAVEEVTAFDGSFVARGRSFETHVGYAAGVIDSYRQMVEAIEARHRLAWTTGEHGGFRFDGEVATIALGRPVRDLDRLLGGIFSCRDPFRLWAVPHKHTDDFATAEVVDLHVGEAFSMDIGRDYVRVYLGEASCGNTVLRLLTNLQRHYDATAQLEAASTSDPIPA